MDDVLDYKLDYKSIDFYQPFNYYDVPYISINFYGYNYVVEHNNHIYNIAIN
jgi:hypothetical protein